MDASAILVVVLACATTGALVALVVGAEVRRAGAGVTTPQQVTAELHRVGDIVARLQQSDAARHGELVTRLDEAARVTSALGDTTSRLREALASSQVRGQWGERMADDVLRLAGLVEGVNYTRQRTIDGGVRPDVTFLLPGELVLHMDVKFPADHYLRALEAVTDTERVAHERAFLKAVREHVRAVASRGYADPVTTPGYALVFIPNESIYGFVLGRDPDIVDVALGQRVVLCSPFTLFAVVAVVRQAIDVFTLAKASDEIIECLGRFEAEWGKFCAQIDRVEKQFDTARRGFDELSGPRRRQLDRSLDRIEAVRTHRGREGRPAEPRSACGASGR